MRSPASACSRRYGRRVALHGRARGGEAAPATRRDERLAAEAGLEVPKPSREAQARERRARDLHGVLAAAEAAFRARLHRPEGRAALDYLRKRGLTDETIARFGLGWSGEGRGALAAELKAEGIEPPQLVEQPSPSRGHAPFLRHGVARR